MRETLLKVVRLARSSAEKDYELKRFSVKLRHPDTGECENDRRYLEFDVWDVAKDRVPGNSSVREFLCGRCHKTYFELVSVR